MTTLTRGYSLEDLADPWGCAFAHWHYTGDKSEILRLLREGEPLSRANSIIAPLHNGILLAAIISGEWKRPKVMGRYDYDTRYFQDERARSRVMRLKSRIARESRRKGLIKAEPYRAALEVIAPHYGLTPDGLEKRIRKTGYKSKSPHPSKAFQEAVREILAKSR